MQRIQEMQQCQLTEIDLKGYGQFLDAPGAFACRRYRLPSPWGYVYTNPSILLRIRHDGGGYLQLDPPGGPALFQQERSQSVPSMFVWLIPEGEGEREAFTNFWLPTIPLQKPGTEPETYECTFAPEAARYHLRHGDWEVNTECWVPPRSCAAIMTVTIVNRGSTMRRATVMPALKPNMAPFTFAPWDVPHLYQTAAFCRLGKVSECFFEARDPGGDPAKRLHAALVTDLDPAAYEVSYNRFVGSGDWNSPAAVWDAGLALGRDGADLPPYGEISPANAVIGQPAVAAAEKAIALAPGESCEFTLVFGKLPTTPKGKLPPHATMAELAQYLDPAVRKRALREVRDGYTQRIGQRALLTPDDRLNRYTNEFLPLQLDWVTQLDRGWPTGMRGTRDAAQDITGVVPLDPAFARDRLLEILSYQCPDGRFLRHYSATGRQGKFDLRPYVDAGAWVWELAWEYLCYTRDFAVLQERVPWFENDDPATALEHLVRLFEYYIAPENLGEHGLCKILEGDWNDSVNRAGLEGRGETVMVSCQAILGLEDAATLLEYLVEGGDSAQYTATAGQFRDAARRLRDNVLRHALNRHGYFNAVFNDNRQWVFSPDDPDGQGRVNGPVNAFAVIAGLVDGPERDLVFDALQALRGPFGWRLFHPAIGDPPIAKLGRIGQGDLAPGLGENGTPYNHGSHGFLGRAAWTAGRGDLLYEVLRYMLPYDQQAHPVEVALTAPYAVVNHWKEAIGLEGAGGDAFLSGSITTAIRNIYQGLAGFRPGLRQLVIDPCIPASWDGFTATVGFLGGQCRLQIANPAHVECGVAALTLDGRPIATRLPDTRCGRALAVIPLEEITPGAEHLIEVRMG